MHQMLWLQTCRERAVCIQRTVFHISIGHTNEGPVQKMVSFTEREQQTQLIPCHKIKKNVINLKIERRRHLIIENNVVKKRQNHFILKLRLLVYNELRKNILENVVINKCFNNVCVNKTQFLSLICTRRNEILLTRLAIFYIMHIKEDANYLIHGFLVQIYNLYDSLLMIWKQ